MTSATQEKRVFIKGNEAVGYGAIAAGCTCYFGYPITPQNEIPEMLSQELPKHGGSFVQAESELAAANMLLGAASAGVRAMTSSSSPGVSLMQEAISYMAGSELPGVIVNMNRGGPGLGDIGPAQGDYYQSTRGGGHGDYRTLTLAPSTCQEAYDMMSEAFDLAFKYRNPVIVLGDGIVGTMKEPVIMKDMGKPNFYDADAWQLDGAKGREKRLTKSLHLEEGALAKHNEKLVAKYEAMRKEARAEAFMADDAELIVVAYGSMGRMAKSAIRKLRSQGCRVGLFRPVVLYPFPDEHLARLAGNGARFLTIEHNTGQMVDDVRLALRTITDSDFHGLMPGNIPSAEDFVPPILAALGRKQ